MIDLGPISSVPEMTSTASSAWLQTNKEIPVLLETEDSYAKRECIEQTESDRAIAKRFEFTTILANNTVCQGQK